MDTLVWLKKNLVPLLVLLLVIAIAFGVFFSYRNLPDRFDELKNFGYLGAFLISILLNATIILPAGNFLILFTLGAMLPLPVVVGLAGGAGAAIGETTGYAAARSGRAIIGKEGKTYARLENWLKRWGAPTIIILSAAPIFFDLVGLAAGALRYPFWKFLLYCWLGRTVLYILIALSGHWGWKIILPYLG